MFFAFHLTYLNSLIIISTRKRICEGYVFTGVCLSTGGRLLLGGLVPGGCLVPGVWSRGVSAPGESAPGGCLVETSPGTATATGGTHPTGMHSFCRYQIEDGYSSMESNINVNPIPRKDPVEFSSLGLQH